MNIEKKDLKFLNFDLEIKSIIEDDPDYVQFTGYASTFNNVDRGDDVMVKGAFNESLKSFTPKLLWQHDMEMPLGIFTEIYEDEKGLYVRGKMPKDDTFVSGRVVPQMKAGSINSMSIGFSVSEVDFKKTDDGRNIRFIKKVDLFEVSLVTLPMNPNAMVSDIKSISMEKCLKLPEKDGEVDYNASWSEVAAMDRVKSFANSTEAPTEVFRAAFLCYEAEKPDEFGSYKHLIADVIDNELVAIPRAIIKATNEIKSLDGEIDNEISHRLNEYYKKMGKISPLEKGYSPMIDSFDTMKEVSYLLKTFGFSNNESNSLINSVKRIDEKQKQSNVNNEYLKQFTSDIKALSGILKSNT